MRTPLADTHAHLNDEQFDQDWQETIGRATEVGVTQIIVPGSDLRTSRRAIYLAQRFAGIFAAVGVHPHEASSYDQDTRLALIEAAAHVKAVAIGEIGLDYYYDYSPRDIQLAAFRDQMKLAAENALPVIIHDREAHADTMEIIQEYAGVVRGVLHCYSGSVEMAQKCVELGYYIGIGGTLTFNKAKKPVEVASAIPLDRILLETDSPYLAPVPYRGKRNEPAYVVKVLEKLSEVKGVSPEMIKEQLNKNVAELFQIYAYNM